MLLLFSVLLLVAGACLILLMPALWGKQIYDTYRDSRGVNCPETKSLVAVRFDALRAAITGLSGPPRLRLKDCSRWPLRADCDQQCIPDAVRSVPEKVRPATPAKTRIHHLPVLLGAAAAWLLGIVWHSEYLFRPRWMAALGLSDRQTRDLVDLWTPHLLTVGACLLFAYGVAFLLDWLGRRSLFRGIEVALSLWIVVAAVTLATVGSAMSREFIRIEGGYTILAALILGAIVGGAPPRLFLKESE